MTHQLTDRIATLFEQGLTPTIIAERVGLSRSAVSSRYKIYKSRQEGKVRGHVKRIEENDKWAGHAGAFIRDLPVGWKGSAADIRRLATEAGVPPAPNMRCWGGLIMKAVRFHGWLVTTGATVTMRDKNGYQNWVPEYRRKG